MSYLVSFVNCIWYVVSVIKMKGKSHHWTFFYLETYSVIIQVCNSITKSLDVICYESKLTFLSRNMKNWHLLKDARKMSFEKIVSLVVLWPYIIVDHATMKLTFLLFFHKQKSFYFWNVIFENN